MVALDIVHDPLACKAAPSPVLTGERLHQRYPLRGGRSIKALSGVSVSVGPGEAIGIVGESGSGKSTLARVLAMLEAPVAGQVRFHGEPVERVGARLHPDRRRRVQLVMQDAREALYPRWNVEETLREVLHVNRATLGRPPSTEAVREALTWVGLDADHTLRCRPDQLSGGQCQRVNIARALLLRPDVLICDESVAALDVSVQAQIINLFRRLTRERGIALVFITHDLGVARMLCDRLYVVYLGGIAEAGETQTLLDAPTHPYTAQLIASSPGAGPRQRARVGRLMSQRTKTLDEEAPSAVAPPSGCRFRTRCPLARADCAAQAPPFQIHGGHAVACHFTDEANALIEPQTQAPTVDLE